MAKRISRHLKEAYTAIDEVGQTHVICVWVDIEEEPRSNGEGMDRTEVAYTHKLSENGNVLDLKGDGTLIEKATGRKMRRV